MGEGEERVQVENVDAKAELLILLGVMADIRAILQDAGLDFYSGLVLYCERTDICRQVQGIFREAGFVYCKSLKKTEWKIPNNLVGFHNFGRYDTEQEMFQFLQEEGFTPILLVPGMIPDFLRRNQNLIVLEDGMDIPGVEILHTLKNFWSYVHINPELLQRQVRLCKSAEFFQQTCKEPLYLSLEVAADVFCLYFRENHDETQTEEMRLLLHETIKRNMELAECYAEDLESTDFIRKAIENFVDRNGGIQIGKVDEIDGELTKKIKEEDAILYDENYYFMSEKILRKACEPYQDAVSILNVKKALLDSGFLCCNDAKEGNFTVKKLLTNAFGYSFRPRFLKIGKGFFENFDSLGLEERKRKCTLEI